MGDSYDRLVEKVQTLSDLELAVLICLIAEQHCIIQTEHELLENVEEELKLVRAKFTQRSPIADPIRLQQLSSASHGQCSSATSRPLLTTLAAEFLYRTVFQFTSLSGSPKRAEGRTQRKPDDLAQLDNGRIANIVIAKNLNRASSQVQIQALEVLYSSTFIYA